MARWCLAAALVPLLIAGCDLPLDGLGDPRAVEADGSSDASEEDAYVPLPPHMDAGAPGMPDDAGRPVLKEDAAAGAGDAHAVDASAPDATPSDAHDEFVDDGGEGRGKGP